MDKDYKDIKDYDFNIPKEFTTIQEKTAYIKGYNDATKSYNDELKQLLDKLKDD